MAKKGSHSKDKMAMRRKFEKRERERGKALKKAEKDKKKADKKSLETAAEPEGPPQREDSGF